jgi:hypothetical protein
VQFFKKFRLAIHILNDECGTRNDE